MKIEKIEICNYRAIDRLTLECSENLNVFAGINGSGKSSILDALALSLSWIVNPILKKRDSGERLTELDVKNGQTRSNIHTQVFAYNRSYKWDIDVIKQNGISQRISRKSPGNKSEREDYEILPSDIKDNAVSQGLPLIAYYSTKRVVRDIQLSINETFNFDRFECYDEALKGASNFRHFFEWFRNREDLENENRKYKDHKKKPVDYEFPDRQLEAVREALKALLPQFTDFSVRRNPLRMVAYKENQELRIEQLSDGEKNLIALVGDIARRLAIGNPQTTEPLNASGIVLIDEIELHLHPSWQRDVVKKLTQTFPNCQFFISTHSPQVLGEVKPENIFLLNVNHDGTIVYFKPDQSFGLESNEILNELMQTNGNQTLSRNIEVEEKLHAIFQLIDKEKFDNARDKIKELKQELQGGIPDLVRAESLITMLEPPPKKET